MKERAINIINRNPTAAEITLRQTALNKLNNRFPGERKKGYHHRDPEFTRLRQEVLNGNYDVFNLEKGGV